MKIFKKIFHAVTKRTKPLVLLGETHFAKVVRGASGGKTFKKNRAARAVKLTSGAIVVDCSATETETRNRKDCEWITKLQ